MNARASGYKELNRWGLRKGRRLGTVLIRPKHQKSLQDACPGRRDAFALGGCVGQVRQLSEERHAGNTACHPMYAGMADLIITISVQG